MRILVVHAWLKGNLGDVLQLSVLLTALRELKPRALDLAGYPPAPAAETAEVLKLADRYLPDPFPWYWDLAPARVGDVVFEPWWRRQRARLFSRYDAIVCAPGPYLASYDRRVTSALCDITVGAEIGRPVVLSSHSICPLDTAGRTAVAAAATRVARESATYRYLCGHGISAVLAADLAFLYPYAQTETAVPRPGSYRLVFLRSNNLVANRLKMEDGAMFEGSRMIVGPSRERLVLATSDHRLDRRFLAAVARKLNVPWVACRSVAEMVQLIAASSEVVSDRYHPAICAASVGKPAAVLLNREPHKMEGLKNLLADNTLDELQELARTGLRAVHDALQTHV